MKILSYKILNEATVNLFNQNASKLGGSFSKDLLKTTKISKQRGIEGANDTLKYMTRYIQLMFNFYDGRGRVKLSTPINVAFGIYFTDSGKIAHLLPYYSKSIQDLVGKNLEYATLQLFDANNQPMNIENHFNNFEGENFTTVNRKLTSKKFKFSLKIPNINTFKEINNKYSFNNLNVLESFANANNRNYRIGFSTSSGFRRLALDSNNQGSQSGQGGQGGQSGSSRYSYISFTVSASTQAQQGQQGQITTQQIATINNIFKRGQQNSTITFDALSRNTMLGRFVTTIQYGNNRSIEIYTVNKINPQRRIPISVGQVYVKSTSLNISNPALCELIITNLR
jgi:hypothetical protein